LIERPHHNILYAVGKSKLANVVLIPCKLLGDQVRFARDRRSKRTFSRKADEFERDGMMSLFSSQEPREHVETTKTLPAEMRQLIADLHAELPAMSWREIAEICYIRYGRTPAHHSVKHIATSGPPPSLTARRYQPWHLIPNPAERKLAVVRLHSEGWSITSMAAYLQTSRPTSHLILLLTFT